MECDTDRVALAALDHSLRLRSLTEDANRGNITFYSIDPRAPLEATTGSEKSAGRGRDTTNAASRQDSLRFIADNTDGLLVGSGSNTDAHITRIVDDVSSYYLMTYSSSNTKLDGRFRAITVRVKRDGVKVRVRRGYRGPHGRRSDQRRRIWLQVRRPALRHRVAGRRLQRPRSIQDSHVDLAARFDRGRSSGRVLDRW